MKNFGMILSWIGFLLLFLFASAKEEYSNMELVYVGFALSGFIMVSGYLIYRYEEIKEERRKKEFGSRRRRDKLSDGELTFLYDCYGKEVTYNEK